MIKKIASILMTLVTVFMSTTTAFAAGEGSISITNAIEGKEYTIYRIFDLESYDASSNTYAYKINDIWGTWAKEQTKYVTVDELGYVKWVENADAAEFATEALAYAEANGIAGEGVKKADSTTVTFTNLNLGYYLVDSSTGALCSLDTTNPSAEIEEKNDEPTVEKEVEEDSTGEYGKTNDADIDQTVNFRTTVTVQAGAENYVLHDKMSEGLTFIDILSVKVDGNNVSASNYTVSKNVSDGCTFDISFNDEYVSSLAPGKEIVVSYTAKLNEDAVIAGDGNPNETWLSYGDEHTTVHDFTHTFTWNVDVYKYTQKNGEKHSLANAAFTLSKNEDGTNPISLSKLSGEEIYQVDDNSSTTEIITNATGAFKINGLDEGVYYLTETQAPTGYNKLGKAIKIVITSTESGEEDNKTRVHMVRVNNSLVSVIEIENKTSIALPITGDIGTRWFYIFGAAMFLSAATVIAVKRRLNGER